MRKLVLLAGLFLVILAACKKDEAVYDAGPQLSKDMATIKHYLDSLGLPATLDSSSGIYYNVITPGNGVDSVKYVGSKFSALYKGTLINGTVFDSTTTTPREFAFNQVIGGWQFALLTLTKGGKMKLYLPSYYGYGTEARTGIPPNSILFFDIEITDINNNVQ